MVPAVLIQAEPPTLRLETELGDPVSGLVRCFQMRQVVYDVEKIHVGPKARSVVAEGECALDPVQVEVGGRGRVD